jgi:hypothetical protein
MAAHAAPLHFYNGRLFIDARVNGIASEALLDSAAEASLIDPVLAAKAKLPKGVAQTIRGSAGEAQARVVEGVHIEALGQSLHPEAVVITDLAGLSQHLIKRPTNLVVGRELFDAVPLRIDILRGEIEPVSTAVPPPGIKLPLTPHASVESIPVTTDGEQVQAEFDLGNGSDVLISRALAKKLDLRPVGRKAGGGIGGAIHRDLVLIKSLEVAGTTFHNVPAAIDDQPNANDLNIGTSILKHFLITTDFRSRTVWLARRN